MHWPGGVRADADVVIVHESNDTRHPPLEFRSAFDRIDACVNEGRCKLILVIPVVTSEMREEVLDTVRSKWNSATEHPAFTSMRFSVPPLRRDRGIWLFAHDDQALCVTGQAAAQPTLITLVAVMSEPSGVTWIPNMTAAPGGVATVSEPAPAQFLSHLFPAVEDFWTREELKERRRHFGLIIIGMVLGTVGVAVLIAVAKKLVTDPYHGAQGVAEAATLATTSARDSFTSLSASLSPKRNDSSDEDEADSESSTIEFPGPPAHALGASAEEAETERESTRILNIVAFSVCQSFGFLILLLFSRVGEDVLNTPSGMSCVLHLRWEEHVKAAGFACTVRLADIACFAMLSLRHDNICVCFPTGRSVVWKSATSLIFIYNDWADLCSIGISAACEEEIGKYMQAVWLSYYFVRAFVLAVVIFVFRSKTSAKALLSLANMDVTASVVRSGYSARMVFLRLSFMWRAMFRNASMMGFQLVYCVSASVDHFVLVAFAFSLMSFILCIVGAGWPLEMWGCAEDFDAASQQALLDELQEAMRHEGSKEASVEELMLRGYAMNVDCDHPQMLKGQRLIRASQQDDGLHAVSISEEELRERLEDHLSHAALETALSCLDVLVRDRGGLIIAVVDRDVAPKLRTQPLDGGAFAAVLDQALPSGNILMGTGSFQYLVEVFCAHTDNDRWGWDEIHRLDGLCSGEVSRALFDQPMDGALVVDQFGYVLHAAVKLDHAQDRWTLRKHDNKSAGTRHAGALSAAVWLSNQRRPSAVFVRSDAGGVHCFYGGGKLEPPEAWYVPFQPSADKKSVP